MQGRVETALWSEVVTVKDNHPLPPPPSLKEGECGYKAYVRRRATEELVYHEEQAKKWAEWEQVSLDFKTMKRGFAANEPHPNDHTLQ